MNKKEVLEIKKFFKPNANLISRICGCYVDGEKNKIFTANDAFFNISTEETFKYLDIFKHTLSGSIGKNLHTLDFPLSEESMGGKQEFLYSLIGTELKDEEVLNRFYDRIIENLNYTGNYYIVVIFGRYDIPGRAKDGEELFDASTETYEYIMCSICPVNLTKAALGYDNEDQSIRDLARNWVVELPQKGFLYPAFNDRHTDIHSLLYYSKNAEQIDEAFIDGMFGVNNKPTTPKTQNVTFNEIISDSLGSSCDLETIKNIQDNFNDLVEKSKLEEEPLIMTRSAISHIFEQSGASDDVLKNFNEVYDSVNEDHENVILASNVTSMKNLVLESPDLTIKIKPEHTGLITTKIIDGKKYFLIPVSEDVTVNGIKVTG